MTGSGAQALQVSSLVDAVHAALRERILTGALPGGARLTELELAALYSVARPTAKAAMERLVHEGLLRRSTSKTARVPILAAAEIRDLYFTRSFVEREVVEHLATRRFVPEAARHNMLQMQDEPSLSAADVVRLDMEFHWAMLAAIDSPRLIQLYTELTGEVRLCFAQAPEDRHLSAGQIIAAHAAILDAVASGARRRAADRLTAHLEESCARLLGTAAAGDMT